MTGLNPVGLVAIAIGLLVGITVHEFSHCLVAYWLGDPTGKRMGRLTLNPLAHLDPLGTLMIVITALTGFGIGWGKPAPVSPWNLRPGRRLGMGLVAAGGPAANLLVVLLTAVVVRPLLPASWQEFSMSQILSFRSWQGLSVPAVILLVVILLNLSLAAFNLLPLPMLDGFHILMGIVDSIRARWARDLSDQLARIEPHGPMILLILILLPRFLRIDILGLLITPVYRVLISLVDLVPHL